jgi:hypothetical protein
VTIAEEPQLFGARADYVAGVTLSHVQKDRDLWRCDVVVQVHNKQPLMRLTICSLDKEQLHTVTGRMVPLMMRTGSLSPSLARRSLWALHNALGSMGFEVQLANCGQDPKG